MRISLFITCLGETFYPRSLIAAVKVLEHLGHEVDVPSAQTCCGQVMYNNGYHDDAASLARRFIEVFEGGDAVVTPSASCAAMVREQFHRLLARDAAWVGRAEALASRTYEFVEFLIRVLKVNPGAMGVSWKGGVTYHPSCHLRGLEGGVGSGGGLAGEVETFLRRIPGIEFTPLEGAEQCCGFGGMFSVKYPSLSGAMAAEKAARIAGTGREVVVCNEAGCAMNIEGACRRAARESAGVPRFVSLVEILAEGLGLMDREDGEARG